VPRDRLALFCIVIGTYLYVRVCANVLITHIMLAGVRLCVMPFLLVLPRNVQSCHFIQAAFIYCWFVTADSSAVVIVYC